MTALTAVAIVLQLVTIAGVAYLILGRARWQFTVDVRRVADTTAAQLLKDYANELHLLEQDGVRDYVRSRYLRLCAETGMPMGAVDTVADRVWDIVAEAKDEGEPRAKGFSFYD